MNDNKPFILLFALILILICAMCAYFVFVNMDLKNQVVNIDSVKQKEFSIKLEKNRESIAKDIEEKYHADMVSYEAMFKRFEVEKQRVVDLKNKLKQAEVQAMEIEN